MALCAYGFGQQAGLHLRSHWCLLEPDTPAPCPEPESEYAPGLSVYPFPILVLKRNVNGTVILHCLPSLHWYVCVVTRCMSV